MDIQGKNISSNKDESSGEEVKIVITLPTNAYFMSGIRDFTLSMTQNMTGFSEEWAFRFQSVVDELCNNAIEHGSRKDCEIRITFVGIQGQHIEVRVEDTGTGDSKMNAEEMTKLLEERKNPGYLKSIGIRGRGLPQIVASWTDELEFIDGNEGGLIVRARKILHEEENLDNNDEDTINL